MTLREFDVIVLGAGGAGLTAALAAASLGARVGLFEQAPSIGGTAAVSGGIVWVPAHDRCPGEELPVDDALDYMRVLSSGTWDGELFETFVRTAPEMLNFVEAHTGLRFRVISDYLDDRPELRGGKQGGRSLIPAPYQGSDLGVWASRITSFPSELSRIGFDVETGARSGGRGGFRLVAGLLEGLLRYGVVPETNSRAVELITDGGVVVGARIARPEGVLEARCSRGVILATGGFEWDRDLARAFLRGPMHGATSPESGRGDGLRMAMAVGADLANMAEAWWDPIVQVPGNRPPNRGFIFERTRPRSIMVNRAGLRFVNETSPFNSLGGAFHVLDPQGGYVNEPAWVVFDSVHVERYGAFGVPPGGAAPPWFSRAGDIRGLAEQCGIDPAQLEATVTAWNRNVQARRDPDFGRGQRAQSGWPGDDAGKSAAERTLGPIDTPPYYAVQASIGALGTKGGPRTDRDARVRHSLGGAIQGLFAAGNAMASVVGNAYGGPGAPLGLAMTWGYRAGCAAAAAAAAVERLS